MRFAYLICAHGSFKLLKRLIMRLDDENNDIYVHVDKKAGDMDFNDFVQSAKMSKVIFLKDRLDVRWGDVSQVNVTMKLLETAMRAVGGYGYYHFISGVDFPLKTNKYIHDFFIANQGKEFVGFAQNDYYEELKLKIGYYHFIDAYRRRRNFALRLTNKALIQLQKILNIHRHKDLNYFRKGCNWWSITDDFAKEIVSKKDEIEKMYRYTMCSDEIFVQTILWHSRFKDAIYNPNDEFLGCMRAIDWKRGNPYIWKSEDFDTLINSPFLFARKFSEDDMEIIDKIKNYLKSSASSK